MFLSDQQKANKAQNADIKLLDLATNAIKEWDQVMSIQDEYTAKFLQESERSNAHVKSNVQQNPTVVSKPQPKVYYDDRGIVCIENDEFL